MFVKVNTEGVLVVPVIDTTTVTNPSNTEQIALVPGWNEVALDKWPFVAPHVQDMIKEGTIELRGKEVDEDYAEEVDGKSIKKTRKVLKQVPLSDIRADFARKIVEGCLNYKDLERWLEDSSISSELRNLADIQLRKITQNDTLR